MRIGAREIFWGGASGGRVLPVAGDWSFESAVASRTALAQSLPPVTAMPSSNTFILRDVLPNRSPRHGLVLTDVEDSIGIFANSAATNKQEVHYYILNLNTGSVTNTPAVFSTYTGASTEGNFDSTVMRDGKILIVVGRGAGTRVDIYRMNQDGSGFERISHTANMFQNSTGFGFKVKSNYDGSCTVFKVDGRTLAPWTIGEDMSVKSEGSSTFVYPYNYIKMPEVTVYVGIGGQVRVVSNASGTVLKDETPGKYVCFSSEPLLAPDGRGVVLQTPPPSAGSTGYANFMDLYSPYTIRGTTNSMFSKNSALSCYLPTGQLFVVGRGVGIGVCRTQSGNESSTKDEVILSQGKEKFTGRPAVIPSGKVVLWETAGTLETNAITTYDFGFSPSVAGTALTIGPFGYNGGGGVM